MVMKKIIIALSMLMVLSNSAWSNTFVKNDWFIDDVDHPVKSITEVMDTGKMQLFTVTKYNKKGFKESSVVTMKYQNCDHRKFFIYYQPYQGNQRTVLSSFAEMNRQELLASWHKIDSTIEKWISDSAYEIISDGAISIKKYDEDGDMQELIRRFYADQVVETYSTNFAYFDSLEDYQMTILGEDVTAIVTLAYDEKGNWVYRKSLKNKEDAIVKRFIEYYEGVN